MTLGSQAANYSARSLPENHKNLHHTARIIATNNHPNHGGPCVITHAPPRSAPRWKTPAQLVTSRLQDARVVG